MSGEDKPLGLVGKSNVIDLQDFSNWREEVHHCGIFELDEISASEKIVLMSMTFQKLKHDFGKSDFVNVTANSAKIALIAQSLDYHFASELGRLIGQCVDDGEMGKANKYVETLSEELGAIATRFWSELWGDAYDHEAWKHSR